jgi:hypothetical protein
VYRRFDFEGDIHTSLACVPLVVRRKLDLAGLKISLAGWKALPRAERLALCHLPAETDEDLAVYIEVLRAFAARAGVPLDPLPGDPIRRTAWSTAATRERLQERLGPGGLEEDALSRLTEEERYAVIKLADPARDPEKLFILLRELGLSDVGQDSASAGPSGDVIARGGG